jgi:carbon monoxide dehydrogenase subunit G
MRVALSGLGLCAAFGVHAAPTLDIEASHDGRRVSLSVDATVAAPQAVVWATLTDYDNTARWIPGMARSVVLERRPGFARVEQAGQAEVLFFRVGVHVVVDVMESPPDRIDVKLVSGDFRHLEGAYRLVAVAGDPGRQRLQWTGTLELRSPVPGFVAQRLLRENVRQQFASLLAEIERRAGADPAAPAEPGR